MANKYYWVNRLLENQYERGSKAMDMELIKLYKQATSSIESIVIKLWLELMEGDVVSGSRLYQYGRYFKLQEQINAILQALGEKEIQLLGGNLEGLYAALYSEVSDLLPVVTTDLILINPETAKEVVNANFKGGKFSERIWLRQDELKNQLLSVVTDSAVLGKDYMKVSKLLAERMNVGLSASKRLVRTETMRVLNSAACNSAKDRGYKEYTVLVEKDACEDCIEAYKGKTFTLGVDTPPCLHPFCKCTVKIIIPKRS